VAQKSQVKKTIPVPEALWYMPEKGTNRSAQKRRSFLSTVAAAAGVGSFTSISSATKVTGDARDLIGKIQELETRHGHLTSMDPEEDGDEQIVTISFEDGFKMRARLRPVSERQGEVTLSGDVYRVETEKLGRPMRKYKPRVFGRPDAEPEGVSKTDIQRGGSKGLYIADDYNYQDKGGSFGTKTVNHDLREYRGEAGVNAAAVGYRTVITDVYSVVNVDGAIDRLELDYSCDYSWTNGAFGSAATSVEGEVVIRNVTNGENVTTEELFESSGTFFKFKDGSDSVSKLTTAKAFGNATYHVGIRATASVDAFGTAASNASIDGNDFIDIGDMDITAK
jgi:hypothetical protein